VLVMFDIDHFKKVNDTYGHQAGDLVLSELATLLTAALRAEDVFARYGGEEFAVICRGTDVSQAQVVGERIRKAVEGHRFVYEGTQIPVTISVGIAALPDPAVKDATDLVSRADKALYQSKHGGRNRVTIHQP
jgi:diguanylate cyclase (GGDEF)-like protein